jgi:hypothetical protein
MPEPRYPYMALDEWKAKAETGESVEDVTLLKTAVDTDLKQIGDPSDRTVRLTISDNGVDRSRDVIAIEGWDLSMYKLNPVVTFAHSYHTPPIGISEQLYIENGKLISIDSFVPREISEFADMVYQMLTHEKRFLRAASVGFRPLEYNYDQERRGVNFIRQELIEHAICPIPDNPRCLADAKSIGIDITPLKAWAEEILDTYHETPVLWIPRKDLETAYFTVADGKVISVPIATVKQGRVLSAKNEAALRGCSDTIEKGCQELRKLIDSMKPSDGAGDDDDDEMETDAIGAHHEKDEKGQESEEQDDDANTEGDDADDEEEIDEDDVEEEEEAVEVHAQAAYLTALKALIGPDDALSDLQLLQMFDLFETDDPAFQKAPAWTIQSLLFPKKHWTKSAAQKWCRDHDYKDGVDETGDHYRMRQAPPSAFSRLRMICMTPADTRPGSDACRVKAIGGPKKETASLETVTPSDAIDGEWIELAEAEDDVVDVDMDMIAAVIRESVQEQLMAVTGRLPN